MADVAKKAAALASGTMYLLHQFGVEYNINEYGWGPKVGYGPHPESTPWREAKEWMEAEMTPEGRYLCNVTGKECVIEFKDGTLGKEVVFNFLLDRLVRPAQEDYEAWACWTGYNTYEEAMCNYGDMPWGHKSLWVSVKGGGMEDFLRYIVPLCWKDI